MNDLYTLTLAEYQIKLRAKANHKDMIYNNTRLLLFEMQVGNANYKPKDKPRALTDVFRLSTDEIEIKVKTTLSDTEKNNLAKLGYSFFKE